MGSTSVRARLTAAAAAVTVVVLLVASAALVLAFARAQVSAADDLARARVSELGSRAERGEVERVLTDVGDDGFVQVVAGARVLGASPSLGSTGPVTGWRPAPGSTEVRDLDAVPDDGEPEDYRVWAGTVTGPEGEVTVYVGTARELVAQSVRRLAVSLAIGLPVLSAVAAGLLWLLLGRVLRPVHDAQLRQQAFVADAAHELQSPLASYRAQLEVALRSGDADGWRETVRDLLADSDRMERLVRDLLFLARDDDPGPTPTTLVDLDDVVLEEVARLRPTTSITLDSLRCDGGAGAGESRRPGPAGPQPARERRSSRIDESGGVVHDGSGRRGPARRGGRRTGDPSGAARAGLRAVLPRQMRLAVTPGAPASGSRSCVPWPSGTAAPSGLRTRRRGRGSRPRCPVHEVSGNNRGCATIGRSSRPPDPEPTQGAQDMTEQVETERRTDQINLSAVASDKVKSLLAQEGRDDLQLRISVQPGGCSGLRYQLFFDERTLDGDVTTDFDGVVVVVDRMSVPYLNGAMIDFVDSIEKQGFTIDNPNATGSCACGDSFH